MGQKHRYTAATTPGAIMASAISTLLACSLVSCATISVNASDGKSTNTNGPITQGNGSGPNGSGQGVTAVPDRIRTSLGTRRAGRSGYPVPMWAISCYTGQRNSPVEPAGNDRGIANWWRGDNAVDELINRIQQGYDYALAGSLSTDPWARPAPRMSRCELAHARGSQTR
ncbi:MAG: hypothetical protein R3B67_10560 [Phycisphaerales bacterium]